MAFLQTAVYSHSLQLQVAFNAVLPETGGDDIPVLYLLHGLSDDHTIWHRRTSIERYAEARGLAVIMPAGNRSFYTDMVTGPRYWTYISEELPAICRKLFRISHKRDRTFAAGLSMGGYGAFKLGLRTPGNFAAVASLSGGVDMAAAVKRFREQGNPLAPEFDRMFGDPLRPEDDLPALARAAAASGGDLPKLWMCCGSNDFLIDFNRSFDKHLTTLGLEHVYIETPGRGHEWGYWDEMIVKALDWLPL